MKTHRDRLVAFFIALAATSIVTESTALAQKGNGNIKQAGEKASDLVSGIVTPLLLVLVGVMVLAAVVARNAGMGIAAIGVGLLAGFFLIDPSTAQDSFEGIYKTIF